MKSIIIGIKYDFCDYEDSSVNSKNYKNYLNKPCPKCGNNLLTQADFDTTLKIEKLSNNLISKTIDWILIHIFKFETRDFEGAMNGSGKIWLKPSRKS